MSERIPVLKTYKMFVGGGFPRSESGRYFVFKSPEGESLANVCLGSRKDVRDAVKTARGAFSGWKKRTAYNRGQILYRMGEMMEGRRDQFVAELQKQGQSAESATAEVDAAVDRLIYYAGWADKFQQVFSAVNPVASSHFNFSMPEPTGVVGLIAPDSPGLLGLVSQVAPAICGGNTVVVLASEAYPLTAITFGEVLQASDLPGGVVNILTGSKAEMQPHLCQHMDVNAIWYPAQEDGDELKAVQEAAALNVKRLSLKNYDDWSADAAANPYLIKDFLEIKTTWHPVGV